MLHNLPLFLIRPPKKGEMMMVDEPLVSICIPTYNRARMITMAIESALAQTYSNIEVLVVDNDSVDDTAAVVASYHDDRLKYIKNERNLGLFGNFNRCVELAGGEYIHILHSDDYVDSDFTTTCMAFFKDHPSVAMTSTHARIVRGEVECDIPCSDSDFLLKAPEGFRRLLATRSFIACPSVIIRRDVYRDVGLYSLEYPYSSDYYQYLKIARTHDIGFVRGACVYYRQGEHSESFQYLFISPQGYLDMVRIFVQLRTDLGNGYPVYACEFQTAQRRFIHDCLFAGFTRADTMPGFSPGIFFGIAMMCWTIEMPFTFSNHLSKFLDFVIILLGGMLMVWSPTRWLVKRLFFSNRMAY